jgi:hypothetical protein
MWWPQHHPCRDGPRTPLARQPGVGPPPGRCHISVPLENADWLDMRDAGAPMAEQLDGALGEATRSVVPSSVEQSAATPKDEGHLDDMATVKGLGWRTRPP